MAKHALAVFLLLLVNPSQAQAEGRKEQAEAAIIEQDQQEGSAATIEPAEGKLCKLLSCSLKGKPPPPPSPQTQAFCTCVCCGCQMTGNVQKWQVNGICPLQTPTAKAGCPEFSTGRPDPYGRPASTQCIPGRNVATDCSTCVPPLPTKVCTPIKSVVANWLLMPAGATSTGPARRYREGATHSWPGFGDSFLVDNAKWGAAVDAKIKAGFAFQPAGNQKGTVQQIPAGALSQHFGVGYAGFAAQNPASWAPSAFPNSAGTDVYHFQFTVHDQCGKSTIKGTDMQSGTSPPCCVPKGTRGFGTSSCWEGPNVCQTPTVAEGQDIAV